MWVVICAICSACVLFYSLGVFSTSERSSQGVPPVFAVGKEPAEVECTFETAFDNISGRMMGGSCALSSLVP